MEHRDILHEKTMKVIQQQVKDFIEDTIPKMQLQASTGQFRLKTKIPSAVDDAWKQLVDTEFSSQGYVVVFPDDKHIVIAWDVK